MMILATKNRVAAAPTPMAGLALGIASLGWCWENGAAMDGYGQFAPHTAQAIWLFAVILHLIFLLLFAYHRFTDFKLHHMVPSWFVPPVGMIVADVSFPGGILLPVAQATLYFGMAAYAVMLPLMIYRLIFSHEIPDAAKPTVAIMAAPASLSLAGYLTVAEQPSPVVIALLAGIAVLMTFVIYVAFYRLLRLPFSPGYAAFTFPVVISATALFKVTAWMEAFGFAARYVSQVRFLAMFELYVATVVVGYVALRYLAFYRPISRLLDLQLQQV